MHEGDGMNMNEINFHQEIFMNLKLNILIDAATLNSADSESESERFFFISFFLLKIKATA